MQRVAPTEKDAATDTLEKRFWDAAYHAQARLYLPQNFRFDFLLKLPEVDDIGAKVNGHSRRIQNLRRTCDLLLPRLLSGQFNLAEN